MTNRSHSHSFVFFLSHSYIICRFSILCIFRFVFSFVVSFLIIRHGHKIPKRKTNIFEKKKMCLLWFPTDTLFACVVDDSNNDSDDDDIKNENDDYLLVTNTTVDRALCCEYVILIIGHASMYLLWVRLCDATINFTENPNEQTHFIFPNRNKPFFESVACRPVLFVDMSALQRCRLCQDCWHNYVAIKRIYIWSWVSSLVEPSRCYVLCLTSKMYRYEISNCLNVLMGFRDSVFRMVLRWLTVDRWRSDRFLIVTTTVMGSHWGFKAATMHTKYVQ